MELLNRRTFVKLGAGGISSLFLPSSLFANSDFKLGDLSQSHFYVSVHISGGWDITLGTDPWTSTTPPKPEDLFVEYSQSDLITNSSGALYGPALKSLEAYKDRFSVVNGIFMSPTDNGHQALITYGLSGNGQGDLPDLAVQYYSKNPGPFGLITDSYPYVGSNPVPKLGTSAVQGAGFSSIKEGVISAQGANQINSPLGRAFSLIQKEQPRLDLASEKLKSLSESSTEIKEGHRIAAAFSTGACFQAFVMVNPQVQSLDSHSNHEGTHILAQTDCFKQIAELFDTMSEIEIGDSGVSVLDRTTFMITSEFTRTPALNNSAGKDHNPFTNSYILMGPNIKGGMKVGGSHIISKEKSFLNEAYHAAKPIELETLEVLNEKRGTLLKPEIICKTIWQAMDLNGKEPRQWNTQPIIPQLLS